MVNYKSIIEKTHDYITACRECGCESLILVPIIHDTSENIISAGGVYDFSDKGNIFYKFDCGDGFYVAAVAKENKDA